MIKRFRNWLARRWRPLPSEPDPRVVKLLRETFGTPFVVRSVPPSLETTGEQRRARRTDDICAVMRNGCQRVEREMFALAADVIYDRALAEGGEE